MKLGIIAVLGLATAGIMGCEGGVEVRGEPATVGVAYENDYYWNGGYQGDYWVYRDRGGHEVREERRMHERVMREHPRHEERHEEHHEHHD